jgi:hypothetical protein
MERTRWRKENRRWRERGGEERIAMEKKQIDLLLFFSLYFFILFLLTEMCFLSLPAE